MTGKVYIPWVEKYRPTDFQTIVLNSENKTIFKNILKIICQIYYYMVRQELAKQLL